MKSRFIRMSKLDKPYMLKNLVVVVHCLREEEFKANDILLIDHSPKKNLLNDLYSVVHGLA